MSEYNIVLVGAGGIGFRHFQSLASMQRSVSLTVVDVSEEALERARDYFGTLNNKNVELNTVTDINKVPEDIDLAVVATSSMVRRSIVEQLAAKSKIRYMILEKILFPREEDYAAVGELIRKNGIKTYVNCSSRCYPGYVDLKKRLEGKKHIDVFTGGSSWGLCCNAIHFVDMMDYIIGSDDYEPYCSGELLDDTITESKRKNYVEMTGRLVGNLGGKASFVIESAATGEEPMVHTIMTDDAVYFVNEGAGEMTVYDVKGKKAPETVDFPTLYQSSLTALCAESLLDTGKCLLIDYERSCVLHIAVLRAFLEHYNKTLKEKTDLCPIT